jgi:hypothetical protein
MAEERYKQPAESRNYHFVFSNLLGSSETIQSIQSITQVNLGNVESSNDLTITNGIISGETVQVRLSGGTELESYKLTVLINTSDSNILELDGILHVREL